MTKQGEVTTYILLAYRIPALILALENKNMTLTTSGAAKTTRPTRFGRFLVRVRKGTSSTDARLYGMCRGL